MDKFSIHAWQLIKLLAEGNFYQAELLLRERPDVLAERNASGETPLLWLAIENYVGAVRWLLDRGEPIDSASNSQSTALIFAAQLDLVDLTRMLLAFKPSVEWRDKFGMRALDEAARKSATGETVQLLQEAGADHNGSDDAGKTALHHAATNCNTAAAMRLLKAGANPNAATGWGERPIHLLAFHYRRDRRNPKRGIPKYLPDFAAALVEFGGDLHTRDLSGQTALHKAAWSGDADAVGHLLALGLDKLAMDEFDRPSISIARERGHPRVVAMLE